MALNIQSLMKSIKVSASNYKFLMKQNAPTILTGAGVAGFIGTVILVARETPEANIRVEKEKTKQQEMNETGFQAKAKIAVSAASAYGPAILTGSAAIGCVLAANHISVKRIASLTAGLSLAESQLREYKDTAQKLLGKDEKGNDIFSKSLAENHKDDRPVNDETRYGYDGEIYKVLDLYSGQTFWSSRAEIERAENAANARMTKSQNGFCVSVNEFYQLLHINETALGDQYGWNITGPNVRVTFNYQEDENTGNPMLVMDFDGDNAPNRYYRSVHLDRVGLMPVGITSEDLPWDE